MKHPGVWCCSERSKCKWQAFALHKGLAWGVVPEKYEVWRATHDKECGGKLIQLLPPSKDSLAGE